MRRNGALIALIGVVAVLGGSLAVAASGTVRDEKADTKALKRKPELDIRRASVANEPGNRVKHKISMQGRLKPAKKFTRPFLLINTRGGNKSDFEYLVLGPRVFKKVDDKFRKVGANRFSTKRKTWVYRFKPSRIGLEDGDRYGWAVLTAKGKTVDLAPNNRYKKHKVVEVAKPPPPGE